MPTLPHARTPQPILDTVEAVLRGKPAGLPPSRIEILIAQRLGSALPTDLSITTVLEDLVATKRGDWVMRGGSWRMRLFSRNEAAPDLPGGTPSYEALDASPLGDPGYVNTFGYRQIDYLSDGRIIITAVNLTRSAAAVQARNWLADNHNGEIHETRIERNLGRGRWGVTDRFVRVGGDGTVRHHDVVASAMKAQREAGGGPGRDLA